MPHPIADYLPTAPLAMLRKRAVMLRVIREFFDQQGFIEVQTPCLSADTVVDTYLQPLTIDTKQLQLKGLKLPERMYLQTSPEFAMKRLMVAGMDAIYQIGPAFRSGERGRLHNPEFTMLEWYRANDSVEDAIELLDQLTQTAFGGLKCLRMTYCQLFQQYAGIDIMNASINDLEQKVNLRDPSLCESLQGDRDGLLDAILSTVIQPALPVDRLCIVTHYPASQAALAQLSSDCPGTAERFELFAGPIELANGYGELIDADELLERNQKNNRRRLAEGQAVLPETSRLLDAMRHGLTACAGVAVGLDRWLMVAEGCISIDQVLSFPIERA